MTRTQTVSYTHLDVYKRQAEQYHPEFIVTYTNENDRTKVS